MSSLRRINAHVFCELCKVREIGRYFCAICLVLLFCASRAYGMYALSAKNIENFALNAPVEAAVAEDPQAESAETGDVEPVDAKPVEVEKTEYVAIKNNLLYDAAATPNLELEVRLAPKWSLEIGAGFNPFPLNDEKFPKWRHFVFSIAPRYWFCNVFNRGFVSVNVAYAHYNVAGNAYPVSWMYKEVKEGRYQGDAVMAGASFGWHFPIKSYFGIELEGGIDAGYTWYNEYECKHCGDLKSHSGRWLVLPKLAVNLVFPLGGDEMSLARRCDCETIGVKPGEGTDTEPGVEPTDSTATAGPAGPSKHQPKSDKDIASQPESAGGPVPAAGGRDEELMVAERLSAPEKGAKASMPEIPRIEVSFDESRRLRSALLRMFFEVDIAKMDRHFLRNDEMVDSIMNTIGKAMEDSTMMISNITIVGYASFDGRLAYNERLAEARANTMKNFIQSEYAVPDSVFTIYNGGESWVELRQYLSQVEFEGRDEVFEIMDTEEDLDAREAKIKKLHDGATYRYMRDELRLIMRNLGSITVYCEEKKPENE